MNVKVNYNEISSVYNDRYKQSPLEEIERFLDGILQSQKPERILEVGCGTAHWLNFAAENNCKLFGADFSKGMLNVAKASNNKINLLNADANNLPFRNSVFDMIFVLNAIHHFGNPVKFIKDVFQFLKPGGLFLIIGLEPRESKNDWYMYKYFKRTFEIDIKRFPTFKSLSETMTSSDFSSIETKLIQKINIYRKGREILSDHFIDKKGASQLALLTDTEYQAGVNKIITDIETAEAQKKEIYFNTNLNFYSIKAFKPTNHKKILRIP